MTPETLPEARPEVGSDALEVVQWAAAAFHANRNADDAALVEILRAAGLPRAGDAVAMLPLAYGRRVLEGLVALPATFVELDPDGGSTEAPLADHPIFAAATHAAQAASRADIEAIGLRSAEVHAVNQALHAGSQPGDLVISPPVMRAGDDADPAHPQVLARAQPVVDQLVAAHGAAFALETRLFPHHVARHRVQCQLDVVARVGERELVESFGALGDTIEGAIADAGNKLARGTLHVLLACLVDRALGPDQVTWERWGPFDACMGPLLRMWSGGAPASLADYLDAIREPLLAASLSLEPHWFRTFVATDGTTRYGLDVLLDNAPWAPGVAIAEAWPWPASEAPYALRHFFMLVPAAT